MSSLARQGLLPPEMAETIAERHIPSLVASPSLDITQDSAGDYGIDMFDDSEFPYARGVVNGVKCCSKCGATKTPQWREGPFGPKTLCNACGVKRTRKLRAEQEGTKRRKVLSSPAPAPAGKTYTKAKAVFSEDADAYDYDEGYPEAAHYQALTTVTAPSGVRRPTRKAAEEAAFKTARYARTGEWAGASQNHRHEIPDSFDDCAVAREVDADESSDVSLPSSDCPEEVSWTPVAAEAAARNGLSSMPLDCYAAVNLMTMSVRSTETGNEGSQGFAHTPGPVSTTATASVNPPLSRAEMKAVLAKMDTPHGGKLTAGDLSELYKAVPPTKVAELVRLNQELDSALHEAQASHAAVAAVAAVLAAKQAAALRSRELGIAATKRLRRFMMELDTQFGVCHKTLPRIRTSPRKSTSA